MYCGLLTTCLQLKTGLTSWPITPRIKTRRVPLRSHLTVSYFRFSLRFVFAFSNRVAMRPK